MIPDEIHEFVRERDLPDFLRSDRLTQQLSAGCGVRRYLSGDESGRYLVVEVMGSCVKSAMSAAQKLEQEIGAEHLWDSVAVLETVAQAGAGNGCAQCILTLTGA